MGSMGRPGGHTNKRGKVPIPRQLRCSVQISGSNLMAICQKSDLCLASGRCGLVGEVRFSNWRTYQLPIVNRPMMWEGSIFWPFAGGIPRVLLYEIPALWKMLVIWFVSSGSRRKTVKWLQTDFSPCVRFQSGIFWSCWRSVKYCPQAP